MLRGRGMVVNVVAMDTLTNSVSAYIPSKSYAAGGGGGGGMIMVVVYGGGGGGGGGE